MAGRFDRGRIAVRRLQLRREDPITRFITFGILVLLCSSLASAKDSILSFDLGPKGYSTGRQWNYDSCVSPFEGFHAVRWLDPEHVLLAFNVDPVCPRNRDKAPYPLPSTLRLVTLDLAGNLLRTKDLKYQAGLDDYRDAMRNGSVWLGPQNSILVHFNELPEGRLLVLSQDLDVLQEIEAGAYRGTNFEGTFGDREKVFFSVGEEPIHRSCVVYTGLPLSQTDTCSAEQLDRVREQFQRTKEYPVPRNHYAVRLGTSADRRRSIVFIGKEEGNFCSFAGLFCSWHGTLLVRDQANGRTLFQIRHFRDDGRAAISSDGKRLATFVGNKLEVFMIE